MPHLLLVDDSSTVLEFGKAVLGNLYRCSTASNGLEALERVREARPDAIVLDLSMPVMDGDQCLAQLKGDPGLREIPVMILSSEAARARACLKLGAEDWLPKPAAAADLRSRVGLLLEGAEKRRRRQHFAFLEFSIGAMELAFPLSEIHSVHALPATRPIPAGPRHLREFVQLGAEAVGLLDLAGVLGLQHAAAPIERRLLIAGHGAEKIAVSVDQVSDPAELPRSEIQTPEELGGSRLEGYAQVLAAFLRMGHGLVPVLNPLALLEDGVLEALPGLLLRAQEPEASGGGHG
jgi:CheY-like chemotaxis protein